LLKRILHEINPKKGRKKDADNKKFEKLDGSFKKFLKGIKVYIIVDTCYNF